MLSLSARQRRLRQLRLHLNHQIKLPKMHHHSRLSLLKNLHQSRHFLSARELLHRHHRDLPHQYAIYRQHNPLLLRMLLPKLPFRQTMHSQRGSRLRSHPHRHLHLRPRLQAKGRRVHRSKPLWPKTLSRQPMLSPRGKPPRLHRLRLRHKSNLHLEIKQGKV